MKIFEWTNLVKIKKNLKSRHKYNIKKIGKCKENGLEKNNTNKQENVKKYEKFPDKKAPKKRLLNLMWIYNEWNFILNKIQCSCCCGEFNIYYVEKLKETKINWINENKSWDRITEKKTQSEWIIKIDFGRKIKIEKQYQIIIEMRKNWYFHVRFIKGKNML